MSATLIPQQQILLIDLDRLIAESFRETVQSDPVLKKYQIIIADKKLTEEMLTNIFRASDISIFIIVDKSPLQQINFLERVQEISPHSTRILMSPNWDEQSLRQVVNRGHIFRALPVVMSAFELRTHLHAAAVEADLIQTQTQLLRESAIQNRELENLNLDLEKIVEERTLHTHKSKEEMDEKLERVRQIIRFIKDLSQNISFEELMDIIRKELRRYAKLGEPIMLFKSSNQNVEILSYRSGYLHKSSSRMVWSFPKEIIINDKELSFGLANHFGRPFVRIIAIPLDVRLIKKYGNLYADSVLCIESSMNEEEQLGFLERISEILKPVSMAVDRSFLENELANHSFRWEKTFDGLKDPIAIVDLEFQVLRSNNKFSEKIVQKKCYQVFADRNEPCQGCPQPEAIQSGKVSSGQIKIKDKLYEVSSYPILIAHEGHPTTVVNQYVDVTQSRELYIRMLQGEKMGAIGLLAGNIAHELNNPLTGIRSLAQVMERTVKSDSQLYGDLKEIEKAAARSQGIIKNLLDFSGGEHQELRQTSLAEIVEKTMPMLKTVVRNFRLELYLQDRENTLLTDSQLLQQVVFNLINNACQAMSDSGTLTVTTQINLKKQMAELIVADTGPGIPSELHDKIFEPFFTTKKEGQGTGLGLSLSRDIVRRLGGNIHLQSSVGKGSQFVVSLPLHKQSHSGEN